MKKATRKKLIEWTITVVLAILLVLVAWYRFFGPGSQSRRAPGGGRSPEWQELSVVATVEVADEPDEIRRGLMGRDSLAPDSGMYFVYPGTHRHGFYMRNTRIPLSIAFIRDDGVIIAIKDMQPFDETSVRPDADYKDALEMNQGWFADKGIAVGDRADLKEGAVHFWRSR
jgi:uncharacterized membrane protein (UPF0127 family)